MLRKLEKQDTVWWDKVKTWSYMIAPCGPFYTIPVLIPFPSFSFLKTLIRNSTRHSLLYNSVENQDKSQQVFLHCCRNSPTIAWQLSQGSYCVMDLFLGSHHYSSSSAQHCHQLWGLAFRASPRAPGFTWRQEQHRARQWGTVLPPLEGEGCWQGKDTCPESLCHFPFLPLLWIFFQSHYSKELLFLQELWCHPY